MSITLPTPPKLATLTLRLQRAGGDLKSAFGGPTQRILRLGSRYAVDVQLPKLDDEGASAWIAALLRSDAEGIPLRLPMPQPSGRPTGITGSGAAGGVGVTASATAPAGALFSFIASGVSYLHAVTSATGTALTVSPSLRVALSGAMEFVAPVIEGFADGNERTWTVERAKHFGLSFTLFERK